MSDGNGIFSAKAKAVMQAARMAARNLGSDSITVEHLLLGLVREESGFAAETLKALKVNLNDLAETVQKNLTNDGGIMTVGGDPRSLLSFTAKTKAVLFNSAKIAKMEGDQYIGTDSPHQSMNLIPHDAMAAGEFHRKFLMRRLFVTNPRINLQRRSRRRGGDDRSVRQQFRRMRVAARISREDALLRRDINQRHAAAGSHDQYLLSVTHAFCVADVAERTDTFRRNVRIVLWIPMPQDAFRLRPIAVRIHDEHIARLLVGTENLIAQILPIKR